MAQDKKKELEAKRQRLQKEIQLINKLIRKNTSKTKFIVEDVQSLNHKIRVKRDLIKVMNRQTNLLTSQINNNIKKIAQLRDDLTKLKADYAEMIRKTYKSRSEQSRLMFLLSSESFLQAYKRVQYMKQYTDYRKKQGEAIVIRTKELQELNKTYSGQKKEKEVLITENRKVQKELEKEKKVQMMLKEENYLPNLLGVSRLQPRMVVLIQIIMLHFIKRLVKQNQTLYRIPILTMH